MNLHPRHYHYDTVACIGSQPRGNLQSCLGYLVCFGPRGIVLCKSRDIKRVEDACGVLNMGGTEYGGVGRKKGYRYSSSCNLIHILLYVAE